MTEFMDEARSLKSDIHPTSMDISKFIRKDFQLILIDHELKRITPKMLPLGSTAEQFDFAHGKSLLQSMKFDSLAYSPDATVELCIEIFEEVSVIDLFFVYGL